MTQADSISSKLISKTSWIIWGFLGGAAVGFFIYPFDVYTQLINFPLNDEAIARLLGWIFRIVGMGVIGALWAHLNRNQSEQMQAFHLGIVGPAVLGALLVLNSQAHANSTSRSFTSFQLITQSHASGENFHKIPVSKKEYEFVEKEIKNTEFLIDDATELLRIAFAIKKIILNNKEISPKKAREINLDINVLVDRISQKKKNLSAMKKKFKIMTIEEPRKSSFRENFIKGLLGQK